MISEAGTDDSVAALAYIAAFAPDKGESVNTLIADPPPGAPVPPILPPQDGFLFLDRDKFHASFAGDLPAARHASWPTPRSPGGRRPRRPGHRTRLAAKPSWYLVASDDRMIPPPAQRAMADRAGPRSARSPRSHSVYVSQPQAAADLIKQAAAVS